MQILFSILIGAICGFIAAYFNHVILRNILMRSSDPQRAYPIRMFVNLLLFLGLYLLGKTREDLSLYPLYISAVVVLTLFLYIFTKREQEMLRRQREAEAERKAHHKERLKKGRK